MGFSLTNRFLIRFWWDASPLNITRRCRLAANLWPAEDLVEKVRLLLAIEGPCMTRTEQPLCFALSVNSPGLLGLLESINQSQGVQPFNTTLTVRCQTYFT